MVKSTRIEILDALRGVAVLGILLMNILWFGMPEKAVEDLGVRGEFTGPNYWAWWMIEGFFHGTMRGVFSMLFGASAVLLIEQYAKRSDMYGASEFYFRRLLMLFLFGLFNAYILLWSGDILFTYALAGMFIFPFLRLSPKRLFILSGIVMVLFAMRTTWIHHHPIRLKEAALSAMSIDTSISKLSIIQLNDIEAWKVYQQEQTISFKREVDDDQIARTQGDFKTFFLYSAGVSYLLETEFVYNFFFVDAFTFMLIGIGLFRMGILSGKKSKRFYLYLGLIGYALGWPIYYFVAAHKIQYGFDPYLIALHEPFFIQPFGRLGMTLGNIGFLVFLFKVPYTSWLANLMRPVGRMAFTNYLLQSVICGLIFSGFAFGWFNKLQRYELYYVVVSVWIFQILFSHVWMRKYAMGPMEWFWRSIVQGKWQKWERN